MALAGCMDGKSRDVINADLVRLGARMAAAKKAAGSPPGNSDPAPAVLAPGPAAGQSLPMPRR
jgi:hypothetical protein